MPSKESKTSQQKWGIFKVWMKLDLLLQKRWNGKAYLVLRLFFLMSQVKKLKKAKDLEGARLASQNAAKSGCQAFQGNLGFLWKKHVIMLAERNGIYNNII